MFVLCFLIVQLFLRIKQWKTHHSGCAKFLKTFCQNLAPFWLEPLGNGPKSHNIGTWVYTCPNYKSWKNGLPTVRRDKSLHPDSSTELDMLSALSISYIVTAG